VPIHQRYQDVLQTRTLNLTGLKSELDKLKRIEDLEPSFKPEINGKSAEMVPDRSFNEFISQNNEWDRNKTEKFKLQALMKRQQE